jgi:hypothetical protein
MRFPFAAMLSARFILKEKNKKKKDQVFFIIATVGKHKVALRGLISWSVRR